MFLFNVVRHAPWRNMLRRVPHCHLPTANISNFILFCLKTYAKFDRIVKYYYFRTDETSCYYRCFFGHRARS